MKLSKTKIAMLIAVIIIAGYYLYQTYSTYSILR